MSLFALIICTPSALKDEKSGASLRVKSVEHILMRLNFNITKVSHDEFKTMTNQVWDIIVVVSFSSAGSLRQATDQAKWIWFDATDSWHKSRISRFKSGEFLQLIALVRDKYRLFRSREIDIITFISSDDAQREIKYTKAKTKFVFVVPNHYERLDLAPAITARLVFVGDGKYGPNKNAIKFLEKLADLLPSDYKIFLIGRNLQSKNHKLVKLGFVSDSELYHERDIHLAPIFSGGGIKNKVAEPLFNNVRVITTNHGASGLKPHSNLVMKNLPYEFADEIKRQIESTAQPCTQDIHLADQTEILIEFLTNRSQGNWE